MDEELFFQLLLTLGTLFGFVYGFVNLIKGKKGYFYSFSVLGFFGCAIGRLFIFFLGTTDKASSYVFNIGSLGLFSGFLCLAFACNTVEKTDNIEIKKFRKYKHIALLVPLIFIVFLVAMLLGNLEFEKMIIPCLYMISAMPCSYFCLRNIITPYPKKSYMRCMRPFFISVLILCFIAMINEVNWLLTDYEAFVYYESLVLIFVGIGCYVSMPILLERGDRKWIKM